MSLDGIRKKWRLRGDSPGVIRLFLPFSIYRDNSLLNLLLQDSR